MCYWTVKRFHLDSETGRRVSNHQRRRTVENRQKQTPNDGVWHGQVMKFAWCWHVPHFAFDISWPHGRIAIHVHQAKQSQIAQYGKVFKYILGFLALSYPKHWRRILILSFAFGTAEWCIGMMTFSLFWLSLPSIVGTWPDLVSFDSKSNYGSNIMLTS